MDEHTEFMPGRGVSNRAMVIAIGSLTVIAALGMTLIAAGGGFIIGIAYLVRASLFGICSALAIICWSIYERGIVIGGLLGLVVGFMLGTLLGFLWPAAAPLLCFNRRKVAYFIGQTMKNAKRRANLPQPTFD